MIEYHKDIEKVREVFDLNYLTDENLDELFSEFYSELNWPSNDPGFVSHADIGSVLDATTFKLSQLLTREAGRQEFDDVRQFCTALILAARPEYKVVRVAGTDYFIVKPELLKTFLDSAYFKKFSINCGVEQL